MIYSLIFFLLLANAKAEVPLESTTIRGEGLFTWYFIDVYKAKLWASKSQNIYSEPISFELSYLRDLKGADIAKQSRSELLDLKIDSKLVDQWYPKLIEIFPDIKQGDAILANFNPNTGLKFYLNREKFLGAIEDKVFSEKFLEIWLSEKTSAKKLRSKLLGINP